jgi:hypothetical protein
VVPLKGNRFKMLTVLRSLALLDGDSADVCISSDLVWFFRAHMKQQKASVLRRKAKCNQNRQPTTMMKRRVGYPLRNSDEEGLDRLKKLRITTGTGDGLMEIQR